MKNTNQVNEEAVIKYEDGILEYAKEILHKRMQEFSTREYGALTSPELVTNFLKFELSTDKNESFGVLFLDNQHNLIKFERIFQGTIDGASVYPRVIIQKALEHNASAIILAHNHPSGIAEASSSDIGITNRIKEACNMIDIRVLDHIIVAHNLTTSFAQKGLI